MICERAIAPVYAMLHVHHATYPPCPDINPCLNTNPCLDINTSILSEQGCNVRIAPHTVSKRTAQNAIYSMYITSPAQAIHCPDTLSRYIVQMHCPYCLASRCIVWHPDIEAPAQDTAATADTHITSNVYTRYTSIHTNTHLYTLYTHLYPPYPPHTVSHPLLCKTGVASLRAAQKRRGTLYTQYTQFIYYTGQYTG